MKKQKRLYRGEKEKMIAGICGGIAEHLETDPTIIRLLWAVGTLFYGIGLLAYLIAWIIIPEKK